MHLFIISSPPADAFFDPRQKSDVLFCENQTGKTNSKNVGTKTVTPVEGFNKTTFFNMASQPRRRFVWRNLVWSAFFYASFLLTAPGILNLTSNSLLLFLFKLVVNLMG